MRNFNLTFFLIPAILVLAGCATLPAPQSPLNKNISWETRAQSLSSIENWDLKAQIAIRTRKDAQTATMHWQQNDKNYEVMVFGPMGANTFVLRGSPQQVELETPQGKKLYANSPEALIAQQIGWNLPVSQLAYWIRGLPAPGTPAVKHFDGFQHLVELQQDGWQIHFLSYTSINNMDLPSKIFMVHPRINVKIIISEWHIQPTA